MATQLEKYKAVLDEMGVQYHEFVKGDYTYIQKLKAHEEVGFIWSSYHLKQFPLINTSQLDNYIEFENGEVVSW